MSGPISLIIGWRSWDQANDELRLDLFARVDLDR